MLKKFQFLIFTICLAISNITFAGFTCVGDSLLAGARPYLDANLEVCDIDAQIGRQPAEGLKVLEEIKEDGDLEETIIICLGTSGPIDKEQAEEVLKNLDGRHIIWVNNYCPDQAWQDENNQCLNQLAESFSNLTIADWHSFASQYDVLESDGIYPTAKGYEYYAQIIINCPLNKKRILRCQEAAKL